MKLKKMLSLLAAAAMAVTALTVSITASAETDSGTCRDNSDNITWSFNKETGVLTLSGEGSMDSSSSIYTTYKVWNYSKYADEIKEVVVEEGITQIGQSAFGAGMNEHSCVYPNLTKITLPSTLTTIKYQAFAYSNIEEITFPDSLNQIQESAFSCSKLKSIDFHEGMYIGGSAFLGCESLKEVTIPQNVIFGRTAMGGQGMSRGHSTFSNCTGLEKIVIEDGFTVTDTWGNVQAENAIAENLCGGCTSLKTVIIKDNIDYIPVQSFGRCTSLEDIYFYNTGLTKIEAKGANNGANESIDTSNNPTFHVIKGSTTEQTLRDAGYLTADNTEYITDTSALETAITEAEEIDTSKYTDETVSALTTAVENGKALLENESATQEEVDQAVTAVKDAISALKEKVEEPTDEPPTDEPPTDEPTEPETQEPTTEPADVTVSVIPDKAYAMPGDEVTYTIHVDTKKVPLYTVQMRLVIPEGMTYVENSGAIVDGVQAKLGYDNVAWTEQSLIINGYASAPNAVDSFDLATFKCKVDEGVADATELAMDLTYLEFTEEGFAKIANVAVAAGVVTVGEDPNPTEPTTEPTSDDTTQAPTNGGSATTPTDKPADNNNSGNNNNSNNNNNGGANGTGTSATDKPVNTGAPAAVGLSAFLAAAAIGLVALKKRNR